MRTHAQIIRDAGGALVIHSRLGLTGKLSTVKSWFARDSIPSDYWLALAKLRVCSLTELATAAAQTASVQGGELVQAVEQ